MPFDHKYKICPYFCSLGMPSVLYPNPVPEALAVLALHGPVPVPANYVCTYKGFKSSYYIALNILEKD